MKKIRKKVPLPSNSSLQEEKEFLNLQNDRQLNIPNKVTTSQQQTNTYTSESTELQQPQHITTDVKLTILEGSSIQGNPDYDPDELTVKKGDKIVVNNADTMPHTVTNGKSGSDPTSGKLFDTSIINGGDSAEIDTSAV